MLPLLSLLLLAAPQHPEALVQTEWLSAHLNDAAVRIVDVRARGYEDGHIPGAVLLANSATRDPRNPPTFLPSQREFEQLMGRHGISNATRVIIYDDRGINSARLWLLLNYFGHSSVALLDGGWTKWTAEDRAASRDAPTPGVVTFTARPNSRWLATAQDVLAAIDQPGVKIVDARTPAEIEGRDLRNIRRGGFIPSAIPVYWEDALDPVTKAFKPIAELARLYRDRGIVPADEVITYCQVALRASHDAFVLHLLGYDNVRVYYGSWEEWGNRDDLPVARVP